MDGTDQIDRRALAFLKILEASKNWTKSRSHNVAKMEC